MQHDLPTMNTGAYASSNTLLGQAGWMGAQGGVGIGIAGSGGGISATNFNDNTDVLGRVYKARQIGGQKYIEQLIEEQEIEMADKRRIVKVFIVDTDENIPLDQCVLYSGEEKLTDANDQELFFEIDINSILKAHNEKRIKIVNKDVKDRIEYLEPARIRDLTMTVVTVASF